MFFLFQKDGDHSKDMIDAYLANGCTDGASDGEHDDNGDDNEPYATCMATQCPWVTRMHWPEGWGSNATNDVAFLRSNQNAATSVHCVCRHCGEFQELRNWPAYQFGACDIAGQNALNNNPYPAGTCGANHWGTPGKCMGNDAVPYMENGDISDPHLFAIGDDKETCCQPKYTDPEHDPSKCRERGQWDNDCRAQEDSASCADGYHRVCVHGCASVGLFRTPLIPSFLCFSCCQND
jgi:hypothetical protein